MAGDEEAANAVQAKAERLGEFFHRLRTYVESKFGYVCIDSQLPARLIFSPEACFRWFDDEVRDVTPKRQQFGSFFEIGPGPYRLHVQVGTTNLHVGVVRVRPQGEGLAIERMGAFDDARVESRLGPRLPGLKLGRRAWGHVWISIDCGDFRPLTEADLEFPDGRLARMVIEPMATALRGFVADRAWAWQAFDRRQWFRFFVDGRFQRKYAGWRGYEDNEAGSVQGMLNGFAFMIENLDRAASLDVPYLLELHRRCMDGVSTKNAKSSPGQTRFREAGFHFYAKNSTLSSLAEIFELRRGDGTPIFHESGFDRSTDELDYVEAFKGLAARDKLRFRPWYPVLSKSDKAIIEAQDGSPRFLALKAEIQAGFQARMQGCLNVYAQAMAVARRDIDRVQAIARLARDLEVLHPFPDGNGRAFPVALASQLLIYHQLPPPIFRDPNIDAELSTAEFTAEMLTAMGSTVALLQTPDAALYNYSIQEASPQEVDAFAAKATELSARLDLMTRDRPENEIFATPDYAAWVTGGQWVDYRSDLRFTHTGSHRTFRAGSLYFGLAVPDWTKAGLSIDEELQRVIHKGVAALVLDFPVERGRFPVPVLVVKDLNAALKALAHRTRMDVGCQTLLITGTEGKTGAKCQLHHVLQRQTNAHAVLNSANTEGPVLFSLANLTAATQVEINEVSVGSDEALRVERARLVSPDLCLFTNIGPNHMDMHKTIENVIAAKAAVVEGLAAGGAVLVNGDNEYCAPLEAAILGRRPDTIIRRYGRAADNAGRLVAAEFDSDRMSWRVKAEIEGEPVEYTVPLLQTYAPLASVGVLLAVKGLGYDVVRAAADFADFVPFETMGRLVRLHLDSGEALFYDQSRRGGMHGMRSAFQDLARLPVSGKIVALVGGISIKKDSDWTRQAHGELAELINASRIDRLYTSGDHMHYTHERLQKPERLIRHEDDINELAGLLAGELQPGDLLFVIGSAYLYLGRVADLLLKRFPHETVQTEARA